MRSTQCPLPPRDYKYYTTDKNTTNPILTTAKNTNAWYYKNSFWIKIPPASPSSAPEYRSVILSSSQFKKYKTRINQIRIVDEYLSTFGLSSSVDVYRSLKDKIVDETEENTTKPTDDKVLNPDWFDRSAFIFTILRCFLNTYFIIDNIFIFHTKYTIGSSPHDIYFVLALLVILIEMTLFSINIFSLMYNIYSFTKRRCCGLYLCSNVLCNGKHFNSTTHYQCKNIAFKINELASLSILRYLPSGESFAIFPERFGEWMRLKMAEFLFATANAHNHPYLVGIRWILLGIIQIIAPGIAIFALLLKMAQVYLHCFLQFCEYFVCFIVGFLC